MRDNEPRSSYLFSGSSTTAVPPESLVGSSERNPKNFRTFKTFKDWLGSFAPSSEISDTSDIQKNLEDLRSSHQELHGGDRHRKQPDLSRVEVPLGSKEANAPKQSQRIYLTQNLSNSAVACVPTYLINLSNLMF